MSYIAYFLRIEDIFIKGKPASVIHNRTKAQIYCLHDGKLVVTMIKMKTYGNIYLLCKAPGHGNCSLKRQVA